MTGELAQIRIEPTGKVTASMSTHSQGHGTATTMAQVIADRLGVPYEDVTVFEGDSSRGGFSPGAAGQPPGRDRAAARRSPRRTCWSRRSSGFAAHLLNASPESIRIEDGMVHVAGAEEMSRAAARDRRDRLWRAASPAPRGGAGAGGAVSATSRRR